MSEAIHFVPPFVFFVLTNRSNTVWRPNMKSWSYYCHSFFLTMWRKMERCSQGCCRGLYLLVLCVDDPNNKPHDDQIWEEIFILLPFFFWQCDEKSIGLYSPRVFIVVLLFVCIGPFLLISRIHSNCAHHACYCLRMTTKLCPKIDMMVSETYDALLFASIQQRHMMNSYFKHDEQIRIWVVVKHYFQLILLTFLWKVVFLHGGSPHWLSHGSLFFPISFSWILLDRRGGGIRFTEWAMTINRLITTRQTCTASCPLIPSKIGVSFFVIYNVILATLGNDIIVTSLRCSWRWRHGGAVMNEWMYCDRSSMLTPPLFTAVTVKVNPWCSQGCLTNDNTLN